METEFIGFAGNRARTMAAAGPAFLFPRSEVRARKPKTMALRGVVRKPWRPSGRLSYFHGPRFAPGNRKQWLCGERSANCGGDRAGFLKFPARGSRPETENNGFAGNRVRTLTAAGLDFSKILARGSRPETEFIGFAGNRARTLMPPGPPFPFFPARGSRLETEFIGFAGNRARTLMPPGPPFPFFPARGSRPETEFIGLAGNRARTLMPSGLAFQKSRPEVRAWKRNTHTPLYTPILTG